MGGSKGGENTAKNNIASNATNLAGLGQTANNESQTLFNAAFPGYAAASQFYTALSSGSPNAIARAIMPATQQVNQATAGAKQNILNNAPSGGEKNLALEQANVSQGAQVGSLASQGYLNSFNALGQLSGQGISQSTGLANTGIGGLSASNQGNNQVAQIGIQQKGQTLGAIGGLLGDATSLGTAGISSAGQNKGGGGGGGGFNIGSLLSNQSAGATGGLSTTLGY